MKKRIYTRDRVFAQLIEYSKIGVVFRDKDHALRIIKASYTLINDTDETILDIIDEVNEEKIIVKIPSFESVMEKLNKRV